MTYTTVCPRGRHQATALATMNIRAVVGAATLDYVAVPRRRLALVTTTVGARFQPRNASGQFVTYAELRWAIDVDYAMTAFEYDREDELGQHDTW
jgi:hypothetical protein